jgi:hypothetical protein
VETTWIHVFWRNKIEEGDLRNIFAELHVLIATTK